MPLIDEIEQLFTREHNAVLALVPALCLFPPNNLTRMCIPGNVDFLQIILMHILDASRMLMAKVKHLIPILPGNHVPNLNTSLPVLHDKLDVVELHLRLTRQNRPALFLEMVGVHLLVIRGEILSIKK